jgi:uncharacterized protein YecE (DUF72 family)
MEGPSGMGIDLRMCFKDGSSFAETIKKQMDWYTGCSGFHYKEWKGVFYPEKLPQREWFIYYSNCFKTLELNVTFYRFPQLSFLENWYTKSPDYFLFAVKVPRLITHYKKFKDTEQLLGDFYSTIRKGLRDKLGPVLFQLPAQLVFSEPVLQQLVKAMDSSFHNVIEFRHISWWRKEVQEKLGKSGISFCGISYPGLPEDVINNNSELLYYRFHGIPELYHSSYTQKALERVARVIMNNSDIQKAFFYFNNTASMVAIENALYLDKFITGHITK